MIGGKNTEMKDEDNKMMSVFGVMVLILIWTFILEKSLICSRSAVCALEVRKSKEVLIMFYNSCRKVALKNQLIQWNKF